MPIRSDDRAAGTLTSPPPLQHLSWSSISTYAQCPKQFEFRYILQAEPERVAGALIFGSAFHRAAVEAVHEARLAGRPQPGVAALLRGFNEAWDEEAGGKPEVEFAKGEDRAAHYELAARMLSAYVEHLAQQENTGEVLGVEEEALFALLPGIPPLKARLDLIERQGNDLVITDLKTSRSRWSEAKVREALPQLIVYAHATMPILRAVGATRVRPRFVVVTKGKKPAVQVLEPQAGQDDVVRLKERVAETWSAIEAGVFPRRESWACASCPYRVACQGR